MCLHHCSLRTASSQCFTSLTPNFPHLSPKTYLFHVLFLETSLYVNRRFKKMTSCHLPAEWSFLFCIHGVWISSFGENALTHYRKAGVRSGPSNSSTDYFPVSRRTEQVPEQYHEATLTSYLGATEFSAEIPVAPNEKNVQHFRGALSPAGNTKLFPPSSSLFCPNKVSWVHCWAASWGVGLRQEAQTHYECNWAGVHTRSASFENGFCVLGPFLLFTSPLSFLQRAGVARGTRTPSCLRGLRGTGDKQARGPRKHAKLRSSLAPKPGISGQRQ